MKISTQAGIATVTAVAACLAAAAPAGAAPAPLKRADAPAKQLEREARVRLPGGTVVTRFEQEVAGVPVADAGAVVVDAPDEPAELLFDESVEGLRAPGSPAVGEVAALAAAREQVGAGKASARLVIASRFGDQLAWEVSVLTERPRADWLVLVSAASGEVIASVDQARHKPPCGGAHCTGSAKLFIPNAVVANDGYGGIKDRNDRDSNNLTALREQVDLELIKNDGRNCLRGDYAHARVGKHKRKICKGSLDWENIKRAANRFEALMAYHHITVTQQYFQTLDLPPINDERQKVTANAFAADNSFYLPSQDKIELGRGGVDDGEDADVIVHEYGHAVHDDQNSGAFGGFSGNAAGAMGEGFGDYLADALSTETVGYDPEWTPCVMEWDATSYDDQFSDPPGICLRRADDPDPLVVQTAQCGGGGSIHCVGEMWASALLELRQSLGDDGSGRSITDRVVLSSHFLLPPSPSWQEAGEALIAAEDDLYGGAHCAAFEAELESRVILAPGDYC